MNSTTRTDFGSRVIAWGFLGLLVVIAGLAIGKKTGLVDYDVAKRGVAMALGAMMIGAGNLLPKFRLFDAPGRNPARILSAERLAGWTFVLGGIAYVVIWALAPIENAMLVSSIVGLGAFAFVALSWARAAGGSSPAASLESGRGGESAAVKRILLFSILLTLLWTVVIFLVDYAWGDRASQMVAIGYPIAIGVLVSVTVPFRVIRRATESHD